MSDRTTLIRISIPPSGRGKLSSLIAAIKRFAPNGSIIEGLEIPSGREENAQVMAELLPQQRDGNTWNVIRFEEKK